MDWLLVFVSVATWLTALPTYAEGLRVRYGPQYLVEANADYRGYDLSPYPHRCGLAVMSPADLGKIVWVRAPTGEWVGPCLAVDVASRHDFAWIVYRAQEVVEVPNWMSERMGFCCGQWGEIAVSLCPPPSGSIPQRYEPDLQIDADHSEANPLFWPYPSQQLPQTCP